MTILSSGVYVGVYVVGFALLALVATSSLLWFAPVWLMLTAWAGTLVWGALLVGFAVSVLGTNLLWLALLALGIPLLWLASKLWVTR